MAAQLTPEQFDVTRQAGTERAFTGQYWDLHAKGFFRCVCCQNALFSSATKFDSGTGWPSFWEPMPRERQDPTDTSLGMSRTEVLMHRMRRPSGSRVRRRPASYRLALLHELGLARLREDRVRILCQGTTSVVPKVIVITKGFSPCTLHAVAEAQSFGAALRHDLSHAPTRTVLTSVPPPPPPSPPSAGGTGSPAPTAYPSTAPARALPSTPRDSLSFSAATPM